MTPELLWRYHAQHNGARHDAASLEPCERRSSGNGLPRFAREGNERGVAFLARPKLIAIDEDWAANLALGIVALDTPVRAVLARSMTNHA